MGLKKRRALCHYRNTTVYSCAFHILTDALVLVCRYLFRYTISSAKHRVPCDKKRTRALANCYTISGWQGMYMVYRSCVQGLTWGAQGVTMKYRRCSCGEGFLETVVKWQPVSYFSIMAGENCFKTTICLIS